MPVNCYLWEHIPSCPVTLVLFFHSQYPSAQRHQTSSRRETMRCQSELASRALCWVESGAPGGNGDISFSLWSALFFQCSCSWFPLTGPQPHRDAASRPLPALGDTTGNCGSQSECLVCPASSISGCHQGLTQVKQCSCGHQIIVRAIWHQLRLRQALPSTKRHLVRHLLTFNYNVAEILLVGLHLTKVSKMKEIEFVEAK